MQLCTDDNCKTEWSKYSKLTTRLEKKLYFTQLDVQEAKDTWQILNSRGVASRYQHPHKCVLGSRRPISELTIQIRTRGPHTALMLHHHSVPITSSYRANTTRYHFDVRNCEVCNITP